MRAAVPRHLPLLLLIAFAAGCGDDDEESTTDAGMTESGATQSTSAGTSSAGTTDASTSGTTTGTTSDATSGTSAGTTADASTGAGTTGDDDETETTGGGLSFEDDVWPVLTMTRAEPFSGNNDSCAGTNGCHFGGAGGLAIPDAATGYANLIDQPSSSSLCAGMDLVVAGDPDASCFVVFYEDRLRDQLGWVDQQETDLVRNWVAGGAAF
jgi:hypothetical protein